jgi:hypothetical protein
MANSGGETSGNMAVSPGGPLDHAACDAEMARLRAVAAGGAREVRRAIAEAVNAERERAAAAERKLIVIRAECEGRSAPIFADILAIIGSEGESREH